MRIRTILCPIDFSDLSVWELAIAAELGRVFGARLVLHHNRIAIAPGLARAWDWEASHRGGRLSEVEAERRLAAALAALPDGVPAEGVISAGPIAPVVMSLAETLPADLIVIGSHGWSTEEHASITERLIGGAPCPVLSLHERGERPRALGLADPADGPLSRAVVPTDFSPTARHALRYACALARTVPLHLELLHVLPAGRSAVAEEAAREQLDASVPADLRTRVVTAVRRGEATAEILAHLAEARPQFAVLGEHARDVVRHMFTCDTARAVVHGASCPVWIVPAAATV
ncbi:MAG TPA: universal stress protein [Candidatus Binatia bacterium]|nr:universal stress protein [Candidatus Binatia bacterium]